MPDAVPGIILSGRRVLLTFMLDEVRIHDRAETRTPGGLSTSWTPRTKVVDGVTVADWTRCRFGQVTGFGKITDKEAVLADIIAEKSSQAVQFPVDTLISEQDRIEQRNGKLWTVVADLTPQSVFALMVRVVVREI